MMVLVAVLAVAGCASPARSTPSPSTSPPTVTGGTVTDTRLHDAAAAGDLAAIARLLAEGVSIDGRDATGRTPVLAATHARQAEAVRALFTTGADPDIRDDRLDNPFLYAGAEGLLEILRLAHEAGADPAITNRYGGVAVIPASERGHVDVVRYLLEETAIDVDHVNNLGWTALLEAIILADGDDAHQSIVRLLLEHGADPHLADRDGVTPLAHARARNQDAVVEILLAGGATR
jgi:ankyrin repeat protein